MSNRCSIFYNGSSSGGACGCIDGDDVNNAFDVVTIHPPTLDPQSFTAHSANVGDVLGQLVVVDDGGDSNITFNIGINNELDIDAQNRLIAKVPLSFIPGSSNIYRTWMTASNSAGSSNDPDQITVTIMANAPTLAGITYDVQSGNMQNPGVLAGDVIGVYTIQDDGGDPNVTLNLEANPYFHLDGTNVISDKTFRFASTHSIVDYRANLTATNSGGTSNLSYIEIHLLV